MSSVTCVVVSNILRECDFGKDFIANPEPPSLKFIIFFTLFKDCPSTDYLTVPVPRDIYPLCLFFYQVNLTFQNLASFFWST